MVEKQEYLDGPGEFTMRGVAPGEHTLFAWPSEAQPEYASPDFLRRPASFGKSITVTEGQTVRVVLDRLLTDDGQH